MREAWYDRHIAQLIEEWNEVYPIDYASFRTELWRAVQTIEPFAYGSIDQAADEDWLLFIDDDDWHAPWLVRALQKVPALIDFVWWPSVVIRWYGEPHFEPRWLYHGRIAPGSAGYAVRANAFHRLDAPTQEKIVYSHHSTPQVAEEAGLRVLYFGTPGAVQNLTPVSITAFIESNYRVPRLTKAHILAVLSLRLPEWIAIGCNRVAAILRRHV